jgi:hypothetical protein
VVDIVQNPYIKESNLNHCMLNWKFSSSSISTSTLSRNFPATVVTVLPDFMVQVFPWEVCTHLIEKILCSADTPPTPTLENPSLLIFLFLVSFIALYKICSWQNLWFYYFVIYVLENWIIPDLDINGAMKCDSCYPEHWCTWEFLSSYLFLVDINYRKLEASVFCF